MSGKNLTIDGQEYAVDKLSDAAKAQVQNLRITDQEIARLQAQTAIAQTARVAYAKALKNELDKIKPAESGH
tara:strand:+ start:5224 stop:5439 length:216 start_codon:yes stop_codon:yes gene_type:complete